MGNISYFLCKTPTKGVQMERSEWREFDRESRRAGTRLGGWIIVAIIFAVIVGGGLWMFKVAVSDTKGRGDATIIKNSAPNRIAAQEAYVSALNEVERADKNLDVLAASKGDSPAAKTRYVGAVSYCQSVVADYNKLGEKYRSADFRPEGYPLTIDEADPATDCKENNE